MRGRTTTPCLYGRDPEDCPACQEAKAVQGRSTTPEPPLTCSHGRAWSLCSDCSGRGTTPWSLTDALAELERTDPAVAAAAESLEQAKQSVLDAAAARRCTCGEEFGYHDCPLHVGCDEDCKALHDPQSPEEWKRVALHYRDHGYTLGCSHGH